MSWGMGVVVLKKNRQLTAPSAWRNSVPAARALAFVTAKPPFRHSTSTTTHPTTRKSSGMRSSAAIFRKDRPPSTAMASTMVRQTNSPAAQCPAAMAAKSTATVKTTLSPGLTSRRGECAARVSSMARPPEWECAIRLLPPGGSDSGR